MSDSLKQTVQWFPGHMAKTRRLIKETLNQVDGVVEILDARIPRSSANPEIDELTKGKPRIILLNKCDLANAETTKLWIKHFESQGKFALAVDCRKGKGLNAFAPLVKSVLKSKIDENIKKGMPGKTLKLMVVGIPNTGKSSFINRLAPKAKAKVADKPGVTRQNQWFKVANQIEILDTPGVLWPKFDDAEVGDKLAFIGSVKDEVIDSETMAIRLIDVLKTDYPQTFLRYKIDDVKESEHSLTILEQIAKNRSFLIKGGEFDTLRASNVLLDEYRSGKLGKISFEKP